MAEPIIRFCPSCGARVKAPAEAFAQPAKCPRCGNVAQFHDHPNDPPETTEVPSHPRAKEPFDYAIMASLGAIPVLVVLSVGLIFFGQHDLAVFISVSCLIGSLVFLAKYSHFHTTNSELKHRSYDLQKLASIREKDLGEAIEKYQGFKTNFDNLIAVRYQEADAHFKEKLDGVEKLAILAQKKLDEANERNHTIDRLGKRLLNDSVKWIGGKITPNNFTASSDRLRKVVEFCRKHEYAVEFSYEEELLDNLREEFQNTLRRQHAKEEQLRIKARIRDEQRAEKELEREMRRIEAEKNAIEKALIIALRKAKDEHSDEVDALREKLREAEEKAKRAKSMAQLTKAGHVYVISNIGSFGEGVYKVGMTRRLEPLDRVKELGDASVPFPFDVHMMISCDDAPSLENALHKTLHTRRLNKVNLRREFFRVELDELHKLVIEHHGEVEYVADPEAFQYRESQQMSADDFAFVSDQIDSLPHDEADDFLDE